MITVVNYGAGNLRSVENTLGEIGATYHLTQSAAEIEAAEKLILPGVGHLGQMMRALDELGLRDALVRKAKSGAPFLGICLGLQAMFEGGEEAPEQKGLALFPGQVGRFPMDARVPHMGWNEIVPLGSPRLLRNIGPKPYVYFAHSYYCPLSEATAATCHYTRDYTAVLESGNIFGVQFHPEKSGPLGLKIVKNFVEL
ncbi:imidazole glycerol phosphate synthase subunit HisH [Paludibaculum fermentans]|uniref:Imidazole glycerol phosphate synthase subunit HisH n=1 Tax=Paludibaculum fermentans TaxID=1473598 RepID=A0A7S7SMZ3_PALFE|nr:imidazole glycerol phosphate synthase subunit HisH [Paludibaculum fermentans]QOY90006.1 imidazole glycerol phosphate synthase subunit HisH [Paludibaculum fermentans]